MKKKLKGFTLIELLIVLAVFGVIMFGALQLIPTVTRMMVLSDVHEGGNAAVSSISGYLENELSTAEYLYAYNKLPATTTFGDNEIKLDDTGDVEDFVELFYEGVLRKGATVEHPDYGNGLVHVLLIDNTANGKISEITYKVSDFAIGIDATDIDYESSREYAVNKAYYDSYSFDIRCGTFENLSTDGVDFDDKTSQSYEDFVSNLSSKNTAFSIMATTTRQGQPYSFVTNSTMSLINIYKNNTGVPGVYYVITELANPSASDTRKIVDITKGYNEDGFSAHMSVRGEGTDFELSRTRGLLNTSKIPHYNDDDESNNDGYCFIYSYGSEINTQ